MTVTSTLSHDEAINALAKGLAKEYGLNDVTVVIEDTVETTETNNTKTKKRKTKETTDETSNTDSDSIFDDSTVSTDTDTLSTDDDIDWD